MTLCLLNGKLLFLFPKVVNTAILLNSYRTMTETEKEQAPIVWCLPNPDEIKVNFDASILHSKRTGFWVIFIDEKGQCLAAATSFSASCYDPLVVESVTFKWSIHVDRNIYASPIRCLK